MHHNGTKSHRRYFAEFDNVYLADEDGRIHIATCFGGKERFVMANHIAALLNATSEVRRG